MNDQRPHTKTADLRREAQQALREKSLGSAELLQSLTSEEARLMLQELRANEAFQRDILNSLPAHVAVLGRTGIILAVNDPWLRFGRENGNPDFRKIGVGVNYLNACRPACREADVYAKAAADGIESVLSGMIPRFSLEYPCDAPGCARWFVMEVIPLTGNNGGAIVSHTCITERKQAEKKILQLNAELEQRVEKRTAELQASNTCLTDFKAALDEHALVAITDMDGTITYANDKFCDISKYSREELLGRNHRIVNSGHHPQEFFRGMWQTILSGRIWRGEVKNRAKDGSFYWLNSTIVPFLGLDGKPVQFIAIRTDITKRKRMEEALQASAERLRLAADAANIAVWEWDIRTDQLAWDTRMFEIYGLPPKPEGRVGYSDWSKAVLPDDLAEQEALLQNTVATCGRSQREFRILRASDQSVRVIQASEMVIAGDDGKADRVVGVNFDATDIKLADERIRMLNVTLESRATALEEANLELESFSYSVSHDLRAPLRALNGFSRMLLEDCAAQLNDEGRRMLGVIHSEAQRMGRLIDDLLAFSRLGRQAIECTWVHMETMVREVFDELAALQPERHLHFNLHTLPPAYGSEPLIRQVWINLISNAIKFTNGREVGEIEIGVHGGGEGDPVYYVKDNGAGFDMRHTDKLFGVFQRLHHQDEFPGTGVGLALVQRIVKRHGGRIWADGEVDHGAAFYFTLAAVNCRVFG